MKFNILLIIFILIALSLALTMKIKEKFGFTNYEEAEFRGMNLMGVNSLDTHIATSCEKDCENICSRNEDCVGYSYYSPGNRCYLYGSGGFVFGRKGYKSGMKIL